MTCLYGRLGVLYSATLIAGLTAGRLSADDGQLNVRPLPDTPTEQSASTTGRRSGIPRGGSALAPDARDTRKQTVGKRASAARPAAKSAFSDDLDGLLADNDSATGSKGSHIRLVSDESSSLAEQPVTEGTEEEEVEFDPGEIELFQRKQAGDEQPYFIPQSEDEPQGFVGMNNPLPLDMSGSDFFPVQDRYRLGFPTWNRYVIGNPLNPYRLNVLKGDYPLFPGGNTFFSLQAVSDSNFQARRKIVKGANADTSKLQTDTQQRQRFFITTDLFEDDGTFTPSPWFVRLTQGIEYRDQSDAVGYHDDYSFIEAFVDYRIAFLSEYGDQLNWRLGRQAFNADFRGFFYVDTNDMSRLFGTWNENKWQYNLMVIDPVQADPVTQLPGFYKERGQQVIGGNVFRRDVPWLGLNVMGGGWYVHDRGTGNAGFQAQHEVNVGYLELAAEGVLGYGWNVSGAFIEAAGHDALNPISKSAQNINAQFAALELTRPTDWYTPRFSVMYASGDGNPKGRTASGFDAAFDNPNFAGANVSYFGREQQQGRGIFIKNFNSFLPNLRNKFFDAVNFVNPGLLALTAGFDTTLTTQVNAFFNYNYFQFMDTGSIEQAIVNAGAKKPVSIDREIGQDITVGINFRPLIINNVTCNIGTTGFFQGKGFQDISGNNAVLFTHFVNMVLVY